MLTPRFIVYLLLILASVIMGSVRFKYLTLPFKALTVLVYVTLLCEISSRVFSYTINFSYPSDHILVVFEILLYSFIYIRLLSYRSYIRQIIIAIALILASLSVFNSIFPQNGILSFPSMDLTFLSVIVVIYSLLLFYNKLKNPSPVSLFKESWFWLNSSNLFFYCITFFIFGFFSPLHIILSELPLWQYDVIYIGNIVLYSCYLIALCYDNKEAPQWNH